MNPIRKPGWHAALAALALLLLFAPRSQAIPAFARKYNVKCYTCHLIPPVLNKTGYMFKRLGYRMPPDSLPGGGQAPKITELDPEARWTLTNSVAMVLQGSFTAEKQRGDENVSKSSFNFDKALLFAGGSLPQTGFDYFVEYKLHEDGESGMEQAVIGWTGGRANNSFFARAGEMHVQEGEGTRAAMMFNLFNDPAPLLTNSSPISFSLDQHPVGVNVGYTWVGHEYKQILGLSAKVTNGVDANGNEILFNSTKNSKDAWFDADYWFGPDGGITFMSYYGRKQQVQNPGAPDEFSFMPTIRRYGIFGNYLFFDKLDVIGGYMRSRDDWRSAIEGPLGSYLSNGFRGEVDYYLQRGFAVMARYDRLNQTMPDIGRTHMQDWGVGVTKALTKIGNVVLRGAYTHAHDTDPATADLTRDNLFQADIRFMW